MLELQGNSASSSRPPFTFRARLNSGPDAGPGAGLGLGHGQGLISPSPAHSGPIRCSTGPPFNQSAPRTSAFGGPSSTSANTASSQFHRLVLASTGTAHLFRRTSGFHAYLLDRRRPSAQPASTNSGGEDNDEEQPDDDGGSVGRSSSLRAQLFSELFYSLTCGDV